MRAGCVIMHKVAVGLLVVLVVACGSRSVPVPGRLPNDTGGFVDVKPTTTTTTTAPPSSTSTTTTTTTLASPPTTTTTTTPAPPTTAAPSSATTVIPCGTYGSVGTYGPLGVVNFTGRNGTAAAPLVYEGRGCVRLISRGWQVGLVANSSYIVLDGFEFVGPDPADGTGPHDPTTGVEIRDSHHIIVRNSNVHDLGGGGIAAIRSNHVTIDGNTIAHTSRWNGYQTSGISTYNSANIGGVTDGYSFMITNNTVSDAINLQGAISDGNCIIIDDGRWTQNTGTAFTGRTYVGYNTCTGNGGRGVHVFQSDNVMAEYNTTSGNVLNVNSAKGELTAVYASNVTYRYNTVTPRAGIPVLYTYSATNVAGP